MKRAESPDPGRVGRGPAGTVPAGATVRGTPRPFIYGSLTLDRHTRNEVAVLGSRAFYDDPFFIHLSAEPMLRARGLALYMRSHLAALRDTAVATGARDHAGNLVGVCVWQRPGTYPLPVTAQVGEMAGAVRALIPRPPALLTGLRYTLAVDKARPHYDHWYLCLLATDPMAWRRGSARASWNRASRPSTGTGCPPTSRRRRRPTSPTTGGSASRRRTDSR